MTHTFSYIVDFRGGTYCSQVKAKELEESLQTWFKKLKEEKAAIKFLGEETLKEIAIIIADEDYCPIMLRGLKNIWCMHVPTRKGTLNVNIVQTEVA